MLKFLGLAAIGGGEISLALHIATAFAVTGAVFFQWWVLHPSMESREGVEELKESLMGRWRRVLHPAIALLLVTGFYQLWAIGLAKGKLDPSYHMWFGIKFVAALGVIFIASALAGRSQVLAGMRGKRGLWLATAAILALTTLWISQALGRYPGE